MHQLVALDDSEPGWAALEFACREHPDDDLTVVHAVDPTDSGYGEMAHLGPEGLLERQREAAEELLAEADERAAEYDCALETATIVGQPAEAIVDFAVENGVDRIVVGSHGRTGFSRVLLGSVAERIARQAPVPVTIVR
ncbi:UspA domain-containing protein [Natrinema pellirubrum DSM 15624]|uniref:Universal stress protein UspA-like protein n=1 Tax=Natrinema pellirubrum (strain DSM 15624 / CIP 106293 / JCM 10476 / NCIMB 786 / 157) TaxID=797303 RepID=L0JGA0_NATP1|nr:universal stress protein [Natrinema pellirubrum]AGB30570.1 universal stress protein UspA-like protein [Natrinema pellirubrum DSM 15624]ELY74955.1 UspA domain-containing protein [Natrinema pellirubrum DSM 15624]